MSKDGEIGYAHLIGEQGRVHAKDKPFSDPGRGRYLQQMGVVLDLLPPAPARVLDMGCGTGWTTEFLHRSGYEVVGVDIAAEMIDLAREVPARSAIQFVVADYEAMPDLGLFDAALFFDALHHAEDERIALTAVYRALHPTGRVVLSEPGLGHHLTPDSVRAMAEFGVTEKEMPPAHIIRVAKEVGFARGEAMPYPFELVELLHEAEQMISDDQGDELTVRRVVRKALARPTVAALGGRSNQFASDDDEYRFLRAVKHVVLDFESSGRGGFTVLHKQ